jgi:hypothetical protein
MRCAPERRGWRASLLLGLVLLARPAPAAVGTVLPAAPSAAPGRVAPLAPDPLAVARARWLEGDPAAVVATLQPWLAARKGPAGRTRAAAALLLGAAEEARGNHNLASAHYAAARKSGGPVAPYGAFAEARVDLARGRPSAAARGCAALRTAHPDSPLAEECLLVLADAHAATGARGAALAAYKEWLEAHPDSPREEEIRLAIARSAARTAPAEGIALLVELGLNHGWPSTDLAVHEELARLRALGHANAALPTDLASQRRRCASLKRSGRLPEAWELFQKIAAKAADDPETAAWVESNEDTYAWGTRQYDRAARTMAARYASAPDAELAWQIFRAWSRHGDWAEATRWGHTGLSAHGASGRWRGAGKDVAWAEMLGGQHAEAAARFAALGKGNRKYAFYAAFNHLRAGAHAAAAAGFDALLASPGDWASAAHYWRAQARDAAGDTSGAAADRSAARQQDDTGWYSLLLDRPEAAGRDGRWPGLPAGALPAWRAPSDAPGALVARFAAEIPLLEGVHPPRPALLDPSRPVSWPGWEDLQAPPTRPAAAPPPAPPPEAPGLAVPGAPFACAWYDPSATARDITGFAERHAALWPDLPAAADLARAGLLVESARLVHPAFNEWRDATQGKGPRAAQVKAAKLSIAEWRPVLLYTGDHHNAHRACWGLDRGVEDAAARIEAARLAWPVVEPGVIWPHARTWDVDPWLVLGIMRQESTYRNTALSPVGAIGLIQVMPRTGARVAAMLGDQRYSPADLEDPSTNLRYGVYYLSRLLDRFDGVFPLAVGSYNGGPHNVSRWMTHHRASAPLDAIVEMMEYDETRDYVKKVSGNYARYARLYEPTTPPVAVPRAVTGDDPAVIDF